MRDNDFLDKSKTTIVFDNEPRNYEVWNKMEVLLRKGWKVVVWPDSITCKDINDMVLASIKETRLVEIINKNTYSGIEGEWEARRWKRLW